MGMGEDSGHVVGLVLALVDAAYDKKPDVRDDMTTALHNLGRKQPELVLSQCNMYLNRHQKLAQGHRVLLLDIMIKIVKDAGTSLSLDLSKELISLASTELTKSKEIITEWQTSASNLLVVLGINFSQEVMAEMLQKIVPGTLPHYFIIYTLANLAKENVFGVVPFLKDIFSRILPMLGLAKLDNIRWAFATCIGAFSEAILDYCANIENAPYPDISKDRFCGEIFTAFEIMFTVWLTSSKEAKVRLAVAEALGHMALLMSIDKLEEHVQRLLAGITSLYRRHSEHYVITQALCMVLGAAVSEGSSMLVPTLDQMMTGLHVQACVEPDYNNIQSVKNNNELLRCFQVLTPFYSERVINFLQMKLETGNDKSRAATLSIFKHLINSSDAYLHDKKEVILSTMSILLLETNLKVCRSFSQCVVAMAHHDYLHLEGGEKLIQFILRMCSLVDEDKQMKRIIESENVTIASVKAMCQNVLHLMSTTVEAVDNVLWPYLLEFILPAEYTSAIMTICRSLSNIAARKHEEKDETYIVNLQVYVNVPRGQALFARLIVLTGSPLKDSGRGIHILTFLKWYSPNIHPSIVGMWETVVPKLIVYLEENSYDEENWNQKAWEDLILKLLAKTLSEIDSEEWLLQFGKEIGSQLPLYAGMANEKNFLYKCLGVLLRKVGTTDFIGVYLNLIFDDVDHTNQMEREGCAVGMGFCAAAHLDQCLKKLEEVTKTQMVRKATGFMGLMKDKSEADVERIKSTVMLCYGYVVFYGPPSLISSRLESMVLRVINPHFTTVRDNNVKQNLIRAVELIGRAVQPSHIQDQDFVFNRKGDLLKHLQNFLCSETKSVVTETRSIIINAITNFVMLDPPLGESELKDLVDICAVNIYPILGTTPPQSPSKGKDSGASNEDENEKFSNAALESMNTLMKQISNKDHSPNFLQCILKYIELYMTSVHDHERDRVMQTIRVVLQNNLETTNFTGGNHFSTLGYILGRLLPRCTDSLTAVRQNSMDCVQLLLTINDRYEGVPPNINDERIQALTGLKVNLSKSDPAILFNVVNELSVVVSKKTPDEQVKTLVLSLIDGLRDRQWQSSSGACAILNCLMKFRGAELANEVPSIVQEIVENLESVTFTQTITGSLVALRTLATHHLVKVLQTFLDFPIPLKTNICEFWKTLAKDKDLLIDTFEHLLNLLQHMSPYTNHDELRNNLTPIRVATPMPLSITAAFTEIFKVPESEPLVINMFAKLLSSILLQMGSSVGLTFMSQDVSMDPKTKKKDNVTTTSSISPLQLSINSFKEFISHNKIIFIKHAIDDENSWHLFEGEETFATGLQIIVVAICEHQPSSVNDLVSSLLPTLSCPYDSQRMVAAAIFAELINQRCCGDMQLVELLMNSLLAKLVDPSHIVRKLCIRGLGNVSSVGGQKLQSYSTTILSAMMAGMDDKEDPEMTITLEAISGLTKILALLNESAVRQILINICLRIRPCFEKEKPEVRAAAISLFGNLSRFGEGASEASFLEQIHTNFVSILLHLNEEQIVTRSCKGALRMLGSLLGSPSINDMFQKHLIEDGHLHYGEFMNDLSRLIIADYLDKMNFYVLGCVNFFKSNWSDIRANAALFVGFLLGNMKREQRKNLSADHMCGALIVLLKDPVPCVRSRAAEAISLLHDY